MKGGAWRIVMAIVMLGACAPAFADATPECNVGNQSDSTECGASSSTQANAATAVGFGSSVVGSEGTVVGVNSIGDAASVAVGFNASASVNSVAIGANASSDSSSVAVGLGAFATGYSSVALGADSVANEANVVSVGAAGSERRIVNVAAGTVSAVSTDAVNGTQLHATNEAVAANAVAIGDLQTGFAAQQTQVQALSTVVGGFDNRITSLENQVGAIHDLASGAFDLAERSVRKADEANEGVAMALAMQGPAIPPGATFAMSGGVGYYNGRAALSTAISMAVSEVASVSAGFGLGLKSGKVGARAGFQLAW